MIPPVVATTAASIGISAVSALADKLSGTSSTSSSNATSGSGSTGSSSSGSSSATGNGKIGQTEFLSLLVAQLQNQDPLNPMDSANFSAQLAQFSSLEQLTQINGKLDSLGQKDPTTTPTFDPVGLIGRTISANGSSVNVAKGDASALEYTLGDAGAVTVEVRNSSGKVIGSAELGQTAGGTHTLDLDDVSKFADLADGDYSVSVKVQIGDKPATTVKTQITGAVSGVDLTTNPPTIRVGELEIPLGDVREVRAPATNA